MKLPKRFVVTCLGLACTTMAAAQPPSLALTNERLLSVFADARFDRLPQLGDVITMLGRSENTAPFKVYVATPYMRAVYTVADAKRRFQDHVWLTAPDLNRDGIVVSVLPGDNFAVADSIEDVVVQRSYDDSVIRPVRREIVTMTIENREGAARQVTQGVFYFNLSDFENLPVTVVCVGRNGNYSVRVSVDDLKW